jgi:hypothetical protein
MMYLFCAARMEDIPTTDADIRHDVIYVSARCRISSKGKNISEFRVKRLLPPQSEFDISLSKEDILSLAEFYGKNEFSYCGVLLKTHKGVEISATRDELAKCLLGLISALRSKYKTGLADDIEIAMQGK